MRGIAREYSLATGCAFDDPAAELAAGGPGTNDGGFAVRFADDAPIRGRAGCDRFVARVVRGVDAPRPPARGCGAGSPRPGCAPSRCRST